MKQEEKKSEKKPKKPWSKAKKIVFGIIMGVAALAVIGLVAVGFFAGPALLRGFYSLFGENLGSTTRIDVSMTEEERLEDLEYLYEIAVLGNSNKEEFEKLYGIDFEEVYAKYQDYVKSCQSDYEFFCICFSFLSDMPSGHTKMGLPVYGVLTSSGFEQDLKYSLKKDESKYLYSWGRVLEEGIAEYDLDNVRTIAFQYVDGSYLASHLCDEEVQGAEIKTINGMNPDEYILEGMYYSGMEYDDHLEKIYRECLYFNDTYGEPTTIVCENAAGEEVIVETYADFMTEMSVLMDHNMMRLDPTYKKSSKSDAEPAENTTSEETSEKEDPNVHKGNGYSIVEDAEHGVIYWYIEECAISSDMDKMKEEMLDCITRYDKVILDIRGNKGGSIAFYHRYVYPVLFKESSQIDKNEIQMPLNQETGSWADFYWNKLFTHAKKDKAAGIVTCLEGDDLELEGNGIKDCDVYLLVDRKTFSSADVITHHLSLCDNVTVIGENTGGEGMEGSIFVGLLPNSRMTFNFTPGTNVKEEISNGVYGTVPDIHSTQSVEAYRTRLQIINEGQDVTTYESRKKWDNVLWDAWESSK